MPKVDITNHIEPAHNSPLKEGFKKKVVNRMLRWFYAVLQDEYRKRSTSILLWVQGHIMENVPLPLFSSNLDKKQEISMHSIKCSYIFVSN